MQITTLDEPNRFFITAYWGARAEAPEDLARRFFEMIDALRKIDPIFDEWLYDEDHTLFELRDRFAEIVGGCAIRDDSGEISAKEGYHIGAITPWDAQKRGVMVTCRAGDICGGPNRNYVTLDDRLTGPAVPELGSYRILHAALLAIVDAWDPAYVEANCHALVERTRGYKRFRPCWMRYLGPELAGRVAPQGAPPTVVLPESAIVEHLPNGGMALIATTDDFDVDNANHFAAAVEIATALQPIGPLS